MGRVIKKTPVIIMLILVGTIYCLDNKICEILTENFQKNLSNIISVASIFIGFLITVVTLMATNSNKKLLLISKEKKGFLLFGYSLFCFILCFCLIVASFIFHMIPFKIYLSICLLSIVSVLSFSVIVFKIFWGNLQELEHKDFKEKEEKVLIEDDRKNFNDELGLIRDQQLKANKEIIEILELIKKKNC